MRFAGPSLPTVVHSGPGAWNEWNVDGGWVCVSPDRVYSQYLHSGPGAGMNGVWM